MHHVVHRYHREGHCDDRAEIVKRLQPRFQRLSLLGDMPFLLLPVPCLEANRRRLRDLGRGGGVLITLAARFSHKQKLDAYVMSGIALNVIDVLIINIFSKGISR